jgi:hypothetical protein
MERRRFKQEIPLDQRLEDHAKRLRKEAQGTPPGIKRDDLIRRAKQAETAAHAREWILSSGLQPSKYPVALRPERRVFTELRSR